MMWGEEREWGGLGMRAAGWVAVNRLNTGWGDNIIDVITQENQFQGYSPTDPSPDNPDYGLFLQALEISGGILSGDTENYPDPTSGATYFANGVSYRDEMIAWAAAHPDSGFWWMQIPGTDIYVCNQWYREEE
jgi:hypothetical protein